jgi:hypothetical protein
LKVTSSFETGVEVGAVDERGEKAIRTRSAKGINAEEEDGKGLTERRGWGSKERERCEASLRTR